jgi:hypothetical protein
VFLNTKTRTFLFISGKCVAIFPQNGKTRGALPDKREKLPDFPQKTKNKNAF